MAARVWGSWRNVGVAMQIRSNSWDASIASQSSYTCGTSNCEAALRALSIRAEAKATTSAPMTWRSAGRYAACAKLAPMIPTFMYSSSGAFPQPRVQEVPEPIS